jgi:methionyl-tRNA synthetase
LRQKPFYITTAIDYATGEPHIGHAFEKIGADAIARFRRLRGDDVYFLMGMDEHGQKVAQAAAAAGISPQELVDSIAARVAEKWKRLGISHDQFIRTTDEQHRRGVRALIERIFAINPDDFYERAYEGWYCVGCELFKRQGEIADGRCVVHPTRTLDWTTERNWFFRLSRYEGFLREHFSANPKFLLPASRRNEILALLESGLEDISVSRSRLEWAIPFPHATSDGEVQGTWVWFDALPNYLTATGYPEPGYDALWPADLHVVGKDITRLHSVIWPAMLKAADLPLPAQVWGHGFVTVSGERFSRSAGLGQVVDEAIDRHGADAFRYFLLREVPWDADGSFTWERFDDRYTSDLANDLGNLANRTLSMLQRYRAGVVPGGGETDLDRTAREEVANYCRSMDGYLLHEGAAAAFRLVSAANTFVEHRTPWKLAADPERAGDLDDTLSSLVRALATAAVLLFPFMPEKMTRMWNDLGSGEPLPKLAGLEGLEPTGWRPSPSAVLFPRPDLPSR